MKYSLTFLALSMLVAGCGNPARDGKASGVSGTGVSETGDGGISTAPGGQGSGPTGTGGDAPDDDNTGAKPDSHD